MRQFVKLLQKLRSCLSPLATIDLLCGGQWGVFYYETRMGHRIWGYLPAGKAASLKCYYREFTETFDVISNHCSTTHFDVTSSIHFLWQITIEIALNAYAQVSNGLNTAETAVARKQVQNLTHQKEWCYSVTVMGRYHRISRRVLAKLVATCNSPVNLSPKMVRADIKSSGKFAIRSHFKQLYPPPLSHNLNNDFPSSINRATE